MNVDQLIHRLKADPAFMENVTSWTTLPAAEGKYVDFPPSLDSRIREALNHRGIYRLYTHQAESYEAAQAGKDFVVMAQSDGCCSHGHPIRSVDISAEQSDDHEFEGKQPCIVIRV